MVPVNCFLPLVSSIVSFQYLLCIWPTVAYSPLEGIAKLKLQPWPLQSLQCNAQDSYESEEEEEEDDVQEEEEANEHSTEIVESGAGLFRQLQEAQPAPQVCRIILLETLHASGTNVSHCE